MFFLPEAEGKTSFCEVCDCLTGECSRWEQSLLGEPGDIFVYPDRAYLCNRISRTEKSLGEEERQAWKEGGRRNRRGEGQGGRGRKQRKEGEAN